VQSSDAELVFTGTSQDEAVATQCLKEARGEDSAGAAGAEAALVVLVLYLLVEVAADFNGDRDDDTAAVADAVVDRVAALLAHPGRLLATALSPMVHCSKVTG
jgi:hypothetical protein